MQEIYDSKVYKQAYVISNFLIDSGEIVMPQDLLDTIEKRMNKEYYFDLNDVKKTDLLPDTEKILTKIYLDCVVSQKEKEKIYKLTGQLKEIILDEKEKEKIENSLMLADLTGLKFFEKIKIKLNRLISFCQA